VPKNIGRYQQGGMKTQPNFEPCDCSEPNRAAPAGAVPRGEQHQKAPHGVSTANEKRMH
jgi:hypothetical protein